MLKNGKVFGKINIIDFSVILLIVLLIFAAYLKFGILNNTKKVSDMGKIEYTVFIEEVRNYAVQAFQVGDEVYDSQTGTNIGTIKAKEEEVYRENISKADGTLIFSEVPGKYNLKLTIETDGIENDVGYFANRSIELKVGSEKLIETLYAKSTGVIVNINCKRGE